MTGRNTDGVKGVDGMKEVDWVKEVEAILEGLGTDAVRVREGGGPEDLAMSLAVSVTRLQSLTHSPWRAGPPKSAGLCVVQYKSGHFQVLVLSERSNLLRSPDSFGVVRHFTFTE